MIPHSELSSRCYKQKKILYYWIIGCKPSARHRKTPATRVERASSNAGTRISVMDYWLVVSIQLYLDFSLCGESGPLHLRGWTEDANTPEVELLSISFHVRVRWFAKVLKECLRHLGASCTYKFCRPSSAALMLHTGCLALPWDPNRLHWVDLWLQNHCPGGVRRSSTALGCPWRREM